MQEPVELEEIIEDGPSVQVDQPADNVMLPADDLVDGLAAVNLLHHHQQRDDDAESGNGPSLPMSPQSGIINTGTQLETDRQTNKQNGTFLNISI